MKPKVKKKKENSKFSLSTVLSETWRDEAPTSHLLLGRPSTYSSSGLLLPMAEILGASEKLTTYLPVQTHSLC